MANFSDVLAAHIQLKRRLAVYLGKDVLGEITLDPPTGDSDELSFIRLIAWSYSLLHETGRVPLNFLKELPPMQQSGGLLPHVRALRTWTSHNLALNDAENRKTLKKAFEWLSRTCGTATPKSQDQLKACISALANDLHSLLINALAACDSFDHNADKARLLADLGSRIDRDWAAFRFDVYVVEAAKALGYAGIDPVVFRSFHLDEWRRLVATSKERDIEHNLQTRIEADLVTHMGDAVPLSAEELQVVTQASTPQELRSAFFSLRAVPARLRGQVLERLKTQQSSDTTTKDNEEPTGKTE